MFATPKKRPLRTGIDVSLPSSRPTTPLHVTPSVIKSASKVRPSSATPSTTTPSRTPYRYQPPQAGSTQYTTPRNETQTRYHVPKPYHFDTNEYSSSTSSSHISSTLKNPFPSSSTTKSPLPQRCPQRCAAYEDVTHPSPRKTTSIPPPQQRLSNITPVMYNTPQHYPLLSSSTLYTSASISSPTTTLSTFPSVTRRYAPFDIPEPPLHQCIHSNDIEGLIAKLSAKVKIDERDRCGRTALHLACLSGKCYLYVSVLPFLQ